MREMWCGVVGCAGGGVGGVGGIGWYSMIFGDFRSKLLVRLCERCTYMEGVKTRTEHGHDTIFSSQVFLSSANI